MEECKIDYYPSGKIYREYYKDEKLHRENLPAVIEYHDNDKIHIERYYIEGCIHREAGPAIIFYDRYGAIVYEAYCLYGKQYDDKDITDNWKAFCSVQIFR